MKDHADFFSAAAALGAIETLTLDAMRLIYRVENAGEDFYLGIADRIADPRAGELLRKNAREERGHAERMRRAIGIKQGRAFEPSAEDLERYPVPLPAAIGPEMLAAIVQGELAGDAGYQRWAEGESDPEIQRLLRQNGREETVHGERVKEVMALLKAPQVLER